MPTQILIRRGKAAKLPSIVLSDGEPAFVNDKGKLLVGNGVGSIEINPLDFQASLNTANFYTKSKVNDYGQIIAQSSITPADIPTISTTKISGLGTLATKNLGITSGQTPVLNSSAKFPVTILPENPSLPYLCAYYVGSKITVGGSTFVPLNRYFVDPSNDNLVVLNADGSITFNVAGLYFISYSITNNSIDMMTAVYHFASNTNIPGSYCRSNNFTTPPYCQCHATTIRMMAVGDKIYLRNAGGFNISIEDNSVNLSVYKL